MRLDDEIHFIRGKNNRTFSDKMFKFLFNIIHTEMPKNDDETQQINS
jgi:hypothetical protein